MEDTIWYEQIKNSGKSGIRPEQFSHTAREYEKEELKLFLKKEIKNGRVFQKGQRYFSVESFGILSGVVSRIQKTFGFVAFEDGSELFIPGVFLKGSIPGDKVLVRKISGYSKKPEGEIISIFSYGEGLFSGTVGVSGNRLYVIPDQITRDPIQVISNQFDLEGGEKVLARVVQRGREHSFHKVEIMEVFGDSDSAENCAKAYLASESIPTAFPEAVKKEADQKASEGIRDEELTGRADFRNEVIFTIDGADSKDLDDAISIQKTEDGYLLGVHIADVSHYVTAGSELDKEAYKRGTSIYYADQVVPMLPKELSNGICSLNPGEDRLAFSALMSLDEEGNLGKCVLTKSVIRSRVKGVYSEVNQILNETAADEIFEKYRNVYDTLLLMKELAEKRMVIRAKRGVIDLESSESKIIVKDHVPLDILPRQQGFSEKLIEEFMLLANEAVATFANENRIPFVYRVHGEPDGQKVDYLRNFLSQLGLSARWISDHPQTKDYVPLLEGVQGTPLQGVVNQQILRSMAKAEYSDLMKDHFGLVLEHYCHFTSPIRRYPDLIIHRILNDYLNGADIEKYRRNVREYARQSSRTELRAVRTERMCDSFYKAEYMLPYQGNAFQGVISGMNQSGIFVELENTVEGFIPIELLNGIDFEYDGYFSMRDPFTGKEYRTGTLIDVICTDINVETGKIRFREVGQKETKPKKGRTQERKGKHEPGTRERFHKVAKKSGKGKKRR